MKLTKQWAYDILQTMPETFSANEFIDKIAISYKIAMAREEVRNGDFLTEEEMDATIQKWLLDN
jgi:hypothetical protein